MSEAVLQLAAGGKARIEIGRSGDFMAKRGGRVTLAPKELADIAASVNPSKRTVILKIGHAEVTTETPDCGVALGAEYDPAKDRLIATVQPTEYLKNQNRLGAFTKISMELLKNGGRYVLDAIAFLGAHNPAIHGLEPVSLAAGGQDRLILCCADDTIERLAFAGADQGSVELHLAAQEEVAKAKAEGSTITYLEGVRRVESARRETVELAGHDPASLELHNAILALIEKERLAGRTLTFLDAARRIERERATKD